MRICDESCHAYKKRLDQYCHRSLLHSQSELDTQFSSPLVQDGHLPRDISGNYELVQVHIVARHGDRSPISPISIGSPQYYECGLTSDIKNWTKLKDFPHLKSLVHGSEKSHSVHELVFPGTDSKRCGQAKLTKRGYHQHRVLGQMLSKRYSKMLSSNDLVSDMFVQSTDYSRTIRSGAAFLLGFLPDRAELRRSTVIYVSPGNYDFLQAPPPWINATFKPCKHYSSFHDKMLKETEYYKTERSVYHPLLEKLTSMFHIPTNNKPRITQLFDVIATRGCHFREDPLPCYHGKCMDYFFANKLFEFTDWTYFNRCTSSSSLVAALPFLRHSILGIMDDIVMGEKNAKKIILSFTHDVTMTNILYALGIHLNRWIAYASRLNFELWRSKDQTASFHIRVLFNGIPVTQKLKPWSKKEDGSIELLPYTEWERFIKVGQYRDVDSYDIACGNLP